MTPIKYALTIMFILLLVSCKATSDQPIKFGVTLTITGFAAEWGENARKSIDLAVERVNAEGGINGRDLKVIYEDFKDIDLSAAANAANKLIEIDGVDVLLTQWTEDTEVILPIAEQHNTPILSISAGALDLTNESPLLARVSTSGEFFVHTAINYSQINGAKEAAILYQQLPYFISTKDLNINLWKERTGAKPFVQALTSDDPRTELTKIKQGDFDVLFIHAVPSVAAQVLKRIKELNIDISVIGMEGDNNLIPIAGNAAEGFIYTEYKPNPLFIEKFVDKYGSKPEKPAALAYDAIMILTKVMREYGTSSEEIQQGLLAIKNYPGMSGTITLDETGDRIAREVVLYKIKDGGMQII